MVYIQINIEKQIISKLNDKLNLKYICNPTRNLQQKKWEIIDSFICPQLYQCLELHFHWGNTDVRGSEHTMDSKRIPLEMHLVYLASDIKWRVGSVTSPANIPDGLAVAGFFWELCHLFLDHG